MQIFIDECGQTGKQLFDGDQPFYCSVAVWLDEQRIADLQSFSGPAELKAATLFGSKKGKAKVANILNKLASTRTTIVACSSQSMDGRRCTRRGLHRFRLQS